MDPNRRHIDPPHGAQPYQGHHLPVPGKGPQHTGHRHRGRPDERHPREVGHPTIFRVLNGTRVSGVYEITERAPQLDWDVPDEAAGG